LIKIPKENIHFHEGLKWGTGTTIRRKEAVWQIYPILDHDSVIRDLCEKDKIRKTCECLLGSQTVLWSAQVILKPGRHGGCIPWHQDISYWGKTPRVTCWLALDDATKENGCMRMIPGSHLRGQLPYAFISVEGAPQDLRGTLDVDESIQEFVPVKARSASFHHCATLHSSSKNTTPFRRRAIAITYEALGVKDQEGYESFR